MRSAKELVCVIRRRLSSSLVLILHYLPSPLFGYDSSVQLFSSILFAAIAECIFYYYSGYKLSWEVRLLVHSRSEIKYHTDVKNVVSIDFSIK